MFKSWVKRSISCVALGTFIVSSVMPSYAQTALLLPEAGKMVGLSAAFNPVVLRGMKVDPQDPFKFEFLVDPGETGLKGDALQDESVRLIRYFLASVTTPEKDLWVNLSPYEKDRIIPEAFGLTEMGRDLLSQDYILKQITASLMYPENGPGKTFWEEVYKQAYDLYGTTDVPVDTFNKVWITPHTAEVYEDKGVAFIGESHLKVMLESDYVAMSNNLMPTGGHVAPQGYVSPSRLPSELALNMEAPQGPNPLPSTAALTKQIIREIILPLIEKEVNEGRNFAPLRQVYQSLILAAWYKKRLKDSVLSRVYADRNKVAGVNIEDKGETGKIWAQYVDSFKKGAYNYIKEEQDEYTGELIPRKYFSGGADYSQIAHAMSFNKMSQAGRVFQRLKNVVFFVAALSLMPFTGSSNNAHKANGVAGTFSTTDIGAANTGNIVFPETKTPADKSKLAPVITKVAAALRVFQEEYMEGFSFSFMDTKVSDWRIEKDNIGGQDNEKFKRYVIDINFYYLNNQEPSGALQVSITPATGAFVFKMNGVSMMRMINYKEKYGFVKMSDKDKKDYRALNERVLQRAFVSSSRWEKMLTEFKFEPEAMGGAQYDPLDLKNFLDTPLQPGGKPAEIKIYNPVLNQNIGKLVVQMVMEADGLQPMCKFVIGHGDKELQISMPDVGDKPIGIGQVAKAVGQVAIEGLAAVPRVFVPQRGSIDALYDVQDKLNAAGENYRSNLKDRRGNVRLTSGHVRPSFALKDVHKALSGVVVDGHPVHVLPTPAWLRGLKNPEDPAIGHLVNAVFDTHDSENADKDRQVPEGLVWDSVTGKLSFKQNLNNEKGTKGVVDRLVIKQGPEEVSVQAPKPFNDVQEVRIIIDDSGSLKKSLSTVSAQEAYRAKLLQVIDALEKQGFTGRIFAQVVSPDSDRDYIFENANLAEARAMIKAKSFKDPKGNTPVFETVMANIRPDTRIIVLSAFDQDYSAHRIEPLVDTEHDKPLSSLYEKARTRLASVPNCKVWAISSGEFYKPSKDLMDKDTTGFFKYYDGVGDIALGMETLVAESTTVAYETRVSPAKTSVSTYGLKKLLGWLGLDGSTASKENGLSLTPSSFKGKALSDYEEGADVLSNNGVIAVPLAPGEALSGMVTFADQIEQLEAASSRKSYGLLVDVSGSMYEVEKFKEVLVSFVEKMDVRYVIFFADRKPVRKNGKKEILDYIENMNIDGWTNIGNGMRDGVLAANEERERIMAMDPGKEHEVVLISDGFGNVAGKNRVRFQANEFDNDRGKVLEVIRAAATTLGEQVPDELTLEQGINWLNDSTLLYRFLKNEEFIDKKLDKKTREAIGNPDGWEWLRSAKFSERDREHVQRRASLIVRAILAHYKLTFKINKFNEFADQEMINDLPGQFTWVSPLKYGYDNVPRIIMNGDIGEPAYFHDGQKAVLQTVGSKGGDIKAFGSSVVDAFQKFMADQMAVTSQLSKKPVYFYAAKTGLDGITKYMRHKVIDQGIDIKQAPVQRSSEEARPISKMWLFLVLGWLKVKGKDGVLDAQSEVELLDLFQESYRLQRQIEEFRLKDYSNSLSNAEDAFLINAAKIKNKMGLEDLPIGLLKRFYSVSDAALGFPDLISALRSERLRKNDLRMIQRQCYAIRKDVDVLRSMAGAGQAAFFNNLDGVAKSLLSLVKHYENNSSRIGEKQFYDDIDRMQLEIEESFFDSAEIVNGGIDLSINKLNLNIKGDGSVAVNAFDPAMLARFEAAPGLVPVMMGMRPVQDLPAFLGLSSSADLGASDRVSL